jgi:acetyl esterase/lipase
MKYDLQPGYELLERLEIERKRMTAGQENQYTEGVDALVAYEQPEDIRITGFAAPGLEGAPDVPLYLYEREGMAADAPLLIAIHGGGFNAGRPDFDANRLTYYIQHVPCKALCVDYRLAPEGAYPAALEDCYAALRWANENASKLGVSPDRIAVAGYSAGGALAAALCLYVRDLGGPRICAQVLTFPTVKCDEESASARQFWDDAPMFQGRDLPRVKRTYLPGAEDPPPEYAFPGYAKDLSKLPPAAIAVGEYDPLRDECMEYATELLRCGVPAEFYLLPRVPHAFDLVRAPMTLWLWEGFARMLRREFGIER